MSPNDRHRLVVPFVLVSLALGVSACGSDEPETTPTIKVTPEIEANPTPDVTMETSEPMVETSEPMEETSEPVASEEPSEEPVGPNDESGVVDVTATGNEGIIALQHSGSAPVGNVGPASAKLIVGPGGCFAVVNEGGQPQLLVFPDDATFVLQEGEPSATVDGTEYLVGRQFTVPTTEVEKFSVAGIPQRCEEGSDSTVYVVD